MAEGVQSDTWWCRFLTPRADRGPLPGASATDHLSAPENQAGLGLTPPQMEEGRKSTGDRRPHLEGFWQRSHSSLGPFLHCSSTSRYSE